MHLEQSEAVLEEGYDRLGILETLRHRFGGTSYSPPLDTNTIAAEYMRDGKDASAFHDPKSPLYIFADCPK